MVWPWGIKVLRILFFGSILNSVLGQNMFLLSHEKKRNGLFSKNYEKKLETNRRKTPVAPSFPGS